MSDFLPMLSGTPDEFEALLLRSADDDEPGAGSLERAGAALGLSAAAVALASTGGALGGQAAVAGNATALGKQLTLWSLGKWLAVGVTAGFVSGGTAHWVTRASSAPDAKLAAPVALAAPVRTAEQSGGPRRGAPPPLATSEASPASTSPSTSLPPSADMGSVPSPAALPPLERTPALGPSSASFAPLEEARAPAAVAPSVTATPASTLGDETKALDRVRADLAAGRPAQALGELERYRATWPRGALAAEATLLRVDALLRSGNRAAAQHEAAALTSAAPDSRYASRARALLGE